MPIGLGARGGGPAVDERFNAYPVRQPITEVIDDAIRSLRLPAQVAGRDTLPGAREVLQSTLAVAATAAAK